MAYNWAYGISKLGLVCATKMFAEKFQSGTPDRCTTGYVATYMTSYKGPKTVEEGADTPVYLSLLPPGSSGFNGNFYGDRAREDFW